MGTNFYLNGSKRGHVGKRSAAGLYCWDCNITLCVGGNKLVHFGVGRDGEWHKTCPTCGKRSKEESLSESTAGRELGFNKSIPGKKTGVSSCCSFSWAMPKDEVIKYCKGLVFKTGIQKPIRDEYIRKYTLKEFLAVLQECPIQYTDMIGENFS